MRRRLKIGKMRIEISYFSVIFVLALLFSISVILYAFMHYQGTPYFYTLIFVAVMGFIVPVGGYVYYRYTLLQNKEYYFPQFLKDLADGTRAGLSLPQAVMNVSKINYGALTDDVRRLAMYISWGVPFDEAIKRFAERTRSKMIQSSVALIVEAYTAGGGIAEILDTMAEDAGKMHSLKEERRTKFSGFISTIYSVYVIFLIISVVLITTLLPEIPTMPSFGALQGGASTGLFGITHSKPIPEDELRAIFFHLAIIEAIFAGLLAGIVGEGSVAAGMKHAIILIFIGVAVFQIFVPEPDPVDRVAGAISKLPVNVDASIFVGRYFLDHPVTAGDVSEAVLERWNKQNIPQISSVVRVRFAESLDGCGPCERGDIQVLSDAIIVNRPTYVTFSVRTDPTEGVYIVYVS